MRADRFIFRALNYSLKNKDKWPHVLGAVIVKGGTILAFGKNDYDTGIHAEVSAILRCKSSLRGADIYVARHRKSQICGLAKPCKKCEMLIQKVGINRVIYTTNDPNEPTRVMKVKRED